MNDYSRTIEQLRQQVEALTYERDALLVAIAEHVEALGGEGNDATALEDSRHQLERLIVGDDLDCGIEFEGIAGQVEALSWLVGLVNVADPKAKSYYAKVRALPDTESGEQ